MNNTTLTTIQDKVAILKNIEDTVLEKHQKEALSVLNNTYALINTNPIMNLSMRSGKTLIALKYIADKILEEYCLGNTSTLNILWIAYDSLERDSKLQEEIDKWKLTSFFSDYNLKVILPNSIHKITMSEYDIVIYNECHGITKRVYNSFVGASPFIIGLTGTIPSNPDKISLLNKLNFKVAYKYSTDDAAKNKSVSDYRITIYEVPLSTIEDIKVNWKGGSFMTSEQKQYNSVTSKISMLNKYIRVELTEMKRLGLIRSRQLNSAQSKVQIMRDFLANNSNKRYLAFAHDTKLAGDISRYTFNSKTSDKYIRAFEDKKIPHLVLVKKASTGYSFFDLDGMISTSISGSNTDQIQKIGRSLIFRPGISHANIIYIISKNTNQLRQLKWALKDLDQSKIIVKDWV